MLHLKTSISLKRQKSGSSDQLYHFRNFSFLDLTLTGQLYEVGNEFIVISVCLLLYLINISSKLLFLPLQTQSSVLQVQTRSVFIFVPL